MAVAVSARLLDIGCGTGAFLREVKRNYPRLAVTGLDLSGPYLAWRGRRLSEWSRVTMVEAAAEAMPFAAAQFDVVSCIDLFHELPPHVRRAVVGEIWRVLSQAAPSFSSIRCRPATNPITTRFSTISLCFS